MSIVFTLRIELGNDVMLSSRNLADALATVADRVRASGYVETVEEQSDQNYEVDRMVHDNNGNEVGSFHIKQDSHSCEGCGVDLPKEHTVREGLHMCDTC